MRTTRPRTSRNRSHCFSFAFFLLLLFVSGSVRAQNCTINAGVDQSLCANATLTLNGTKSGLFQGAGTTTWSLVSGPGASITSPNAMSTTVTGISAGAYVFRISTTCLDGSPIYDDVNVTVTAITLSNAGSAQSYCPGTYALAANSAAPGTGAWSVVGTNNGITISTPSSPTSNIVVNGNSVGLTTLRWTISQNGCTSTSDVAITNLGGITPVSAGPDQVLGACYTSTTSATFNGSSAGNGTGGQGGTWTLVSGPNTPTITTPASRTSTVTNLIQGVYVFRWTVTGTCVSGSDEMQITVPAPSSSITAANAGGNQVYCDARSTVTLSGNNPGFAGETGMWTQTSGPVGPVINSPNSPVTSITGLNGTSGYTFTYTITNPSGCTSANNATISYNGTPAITVNSGNDYINLACGATSASIPYTVSGGSTTQYRVLSGPAGYTLPGSYSNSGSSPQTITGLTIPGTYLVRFQRTGGTGCITAFDDVYVTVSQTPTASVAGTNQVLACNVFNSSLAGNVPAIGAGSWSQVSGPNAANIVNPASNTSAINGMTNGTYVFKWIVSGGPACAAAENVVSVMVASTMPGQANAGVDRTICSGSPVPLSGNAAALNETGTWTVTPSLGISFSDTHAPNAVVTGMQNGVAYTFTWTIVNACGTSSDDVVITVNNAEGPVQANAGADQCLASGTASLSLSGNAPNPAGATGTWTQVGGNPVTISNAAQNNPMLTGLSNGTYEFEWSLNVTGCPSTTDRVLVTISAPATIATAGADQHICGSSATLAANNPSVGTGNWSQVAGPGGAEISSPSASSTSLTGLVPGSYTFRWTVSNGACASNYDDVVVNVSQPPAALPAGPNQNCLTTSTATMAATAPSTGVGTWSQVSGPNLGNIATATSNTSQITGLINGIYQFRWTVPGSASCPAATSEVTVSVNMAATAGGNSTICNSSTVSLSGTTGSTGTWSQVGTTPNTATITQTPANGYMGNATGLVPGVYTFRYTLTPVAGCTPTSADRVVTVAAPPTAAAGIDQSLCNANSITLNGTAATAPATGTWTKLSGPATGAFTPNANTPGATLSISTPGLYTFQWTVNNSGCTAGDQVTVNVAPLPSTANAGPDQSLCGPTSVTMAATAPASGTGAWSQVSGPNTPSVSNAALATATINGLVNGNYSYRWTVSSGSCAANMDEVDLAVCASVLPVRLIRFDGVRRGGLIQLTWNTAEEINARSFILERSHGASGFMPVREVPARGYATGYTCIDTLPAGANGVLYRLKMVDKDGQYQYSRVVSVNLNANASAELLLAGNPVRTRLKAELRVPESKPASIRVVNGSGAVVWKTQLALAKGSNSIEVDESRHWAAGFYVLIVELKDGQLMKKFQIQR